MWTFRLGKLDAIYCKNWCRLAGDTVFVSVTKHQRNIGVFFYVFAVLFLNVNYSNRCSAQDVSVLFNTFDIWKAEITDGQKCESNGHLCWRKRCDVSILESDLVKSVRFLKSCHRRVHRSLPSIKHINYRILIRRMITDDDDIRYLLSIPSLFCFRHCAWFVFFCVCHQLIVSVYFLIQIQRK